MIKAKAFQKQYLENLTTVKYHPMKLWEYHTFFGEESTGTYIRDSQEGIHDIFFPEDINQVKEKIIQEAEEQYAQTTGKTVPPKKTINDMEEILWHESWHAATGVYPEKGEILVDTFQAKEKNDNDYHSNLAERYVRKKALDRDLKKLGIKEYGEEFTETHYKKMMDAFDNFQLSDDAYEFVEMTIKETNKKKENDNVDANDRRKKMVDWKIFKKIIDEIAVNEQTTPNPDSGVPV